MFCYTIMLKNTDNMRKVLNIIHYTAYGYIRPESRFNASLATNTKKKKRVEKSIARIYTIFAAVKIFVTF